ncbi:TlpA family protein disulfide reductase [Hymenobacter arizonensis]|uniref:Thiol-disulfide isomerase or thioredoxin n=1 Tax=Hymenobacter arizonensis TaxID=1227077 RepID=A0A1I6AIU0_HYMAR|nr:TlpA disulfide reductase family protein [Hymenobacter arizonensis]SFQ68582.1 Thiol-disulfide isomerase or thioredoxin [Hymenobacter arizonensis]
MKTMLTRKNLLSWLPFAVLALVMFTDLRPLVQGQVQRGLLSTGLWNAPLPAPPAAMPVVKTGLAAYPHNVALLSLAGQPVNLSELQGKTVFVNLWASWCGPCLAEMPGIQALYEKADPTKVAFVMISLDERPARAQALLKRRGYTFPVYVPAAPLPAPFNSQSIPSTVILRPDGQVAVRHDGMANYDTPEFRAALENLALSSQ